MKLKLFTIGLLATIAMTSTNVEATQKRQASIQAAKELPQVKAEIGAASANLDVAHGGAHPGDPAAAINHIHTGLGTHAAAGGGAADTANHRIDALKATLGHAPLGAAHGANKRAEDAKTALEAGAADIHTAITNINTLLGGLGGADIHAKLTTLRTDLGVTGPDINQRIGAIMTPLGNVRTAPGAGVAGTIEEKLVAILNRLKVGLRANAAGGIAVVGHAGVAVAGFGGKGGPGGVIDAALNIEAVLTEAGW